MSNVNQILPTRRIGTTSLAVTEIGFGAAPIGNFRFNTSDDDAHGAMAALWSGGGRLYDTSPFYGYGRSELRTGRYLCGVDPEQYVLSTKIGRWMRRQRPGDDLSKLRPNGLPFWPTFDYSYDGVMRSLEQSYLRLGLKRIDIVLIHDCDATTHGTDAAAEPYFKAAMDGGYRALAELRRSGDIKAIGAGINDTRWCRRFVEAGDFDVMMLAGQYTLLEHSDETRELVALCQKRQVSLLLAGVFNSGILAGGSASGAAFHYQRPPAEVLQRVARIEAICKAHGTTLAAAAIQFALAEPVVASAVLGATAAHEVHSNLAAARVKIPLALWSDLKSGGLLARDLPVPTAVA